MRCCELAHTINKWKELWIASCVVEIYCEIITGEQKETKRGKKIAKKTEKTNCVENNNNEREKQSESREEFVAGAFCICMCVCLCRKLQCGPGEGCWGWCEAATLVILTRMNFRSKEIDVFFNFAKDSSILNKLYLKAKLTLLLVSFSICMHFLYCSNLVFS